MAGLTYATYKATLATLSVVPETDPNWLEILPSAIDYAELRIYRDLDLLQTVKKSYEYNCEPNTMNTNVPVGDFVTLQSINVITPITALNPSDGTRNPLIPTSLNYLQYAYPNSAGSGVPQFFAMIDQNSFALGPWPDDAYMLEIVGTYRPESLSSTNSHTFISLYLPDLFLMASMVFISGYQRNFGRQSDDPAMAQSYESQYQALLRGATVEEYRKKFAASGWTSISPSPVATVGRG